MSCGVCPSRAPCGSLFRIPSLHLSSWSSLSRLRLCVHLRYLRPAVSGLPGNVLEIPIPSPTQAPVVAASESFKLGCSGLCSGSQACDVIVMVWEPLQRKSPYGYYFCSSPILSLLLDLNVWPLKFCDFDVYCDFLQPWSFLQIITCCFSTGMVMAPDFFGLFLSCSVASSWAYARPAFSHSTGPPAWWCCLTQWAGLTYVSEKLRQPSRDLPWVLRGFLLGDSKPRWQAGQAR